MTNEPRTHSVLVSFDYREGSTFDQLSRAMGDFQRAFSAYARDKKAKLEVVRFDHGSLQCSLIADETGFTGIKVMAGDLERLAAGKRAVLMPEAARNSFRSLLSEVRSVRLAAEGREYALPELAVRFLDDKPIDGTPRRTQHSGILDQVDLRSNHFRIMLANGHRLRCQPAVKFIDAIRMSLSQDLPRLVVSGDATFSKTGFLPHRMIVLHVEAITRAASLSEHLALVDASVDRNALAHAMDAATLAFEKRYDPFIDSEADD